VIYFSTACYVLGRELGPLDAQAELRGQVLEPTGESLPCARVGARMRLIDDISLHIDAAATSIGRYRARALHMAREARATHDVWVSCDDDVEADLQTCRWLVQAVRESKGVCIAPCWLRRTEPIVNLVLTEAVARPIIGGNEPGGVVIGARAGGFGLVAMHQDAIELLYQAQAERLTFIDEDGIAKLGAFVEVVEGGKWWTEDLAFFLKWLPSSVRVEALVTGQTVHDGRLLKLEQVPALPRIGSTVPELVKL
jgi:hypothetical protein